ncbi:MAG: cytochrome c biogenesis protein CcdA [Desulfovibrionaceae bacterium]
MKNIANQIIRCIHLLLLLLALAGASTTWAQKPYTAGEEPFELSFATYRLESDAATQDTPVLKTPRLLGVLTLTPLDGWYAYATDHPGTVGTPPVLQLSTSPGEARLVPYMPPGVNKPDPFQPGGIMRVYMEPTPLFLPLPEGSLPASVAGRIRLVLCKETRCRETAVKLDFPLDLSNPQTLPLAEEQSWWPLYQQALQLGPQQTGQQQTPVFRPAAATEEKDAPAEEDTVSAPTSDIVWELQPRPFEPGFEVGGLATALLFGLLAGFILNFMPCVLPVVSLKLSGLLSGAEKDVETQKSSFRRHNLFFALGVLVYFLFLALLLAFTGLAWGEIFQEPKLVAVLAALVLALALSLFGVYNLPVVDLKLGTQTTRPGAQAFFTGVLATLLATPCSGPFLGGVLGWALLSPPLEIALIFLTIGTGMALPYLVMAAWPGLARFFPKPGAWTEYVERGAGFFLLGTCAYLVNMLPEEYLTRTLVLLWFISLAAWIWGLAGPDASGGKRAALRGIALALALGSIFWSLAPRSETTPWLPFEPASFSKQLGTELIVADFTADWCPTCKFLEQTVLTDTNVRELRKKFNAVFVRVDLTDDNPAAEALLKALGSQSIPLLAIFPAGEAASSPLVLRDIFTKENIRQALSNASGPPKE